MKRLLQSFVIISLLSALIAAPSHALRSIKHQSFTDPDYVGFKPAKVVLMVVAMDFEIRDTIQTHMIKALSKKKVEVFLYQDLFPPTREWTEEEIKQAYAEQGVSAGILVAAGASSSETMQVGSHSFSRGSTYGNVQSNGDNATFSASNSASTQTYGIFKKNSRASFSAVLTDLKTNRIAWYSDIFTKAGGAFFVGEKRDAKAAVKGVVRGLLEKGHLPEARTRKK